MSNWMAGQEYSTTGEWNAYATYSGGNSYQQPYGTGYSSTLLSPKSTLSTQDEGSSAERTLENIGRGAATGWNAGSSSGSAAGGAMSGAMEGYQATGSWYGAVVGGITGYFGGKDKEKQANKNSDMALLKYKMEEEEKLRQRKIQETKDAFAQYTPGLTPNSFQYQNNAFSNGGSPMFGVQQPTQPVVNPEQNSYGLLRGPNGN